MFQIRLGGRAQDFFPQNVSILFVPKCIEREGVKVLDFLRRYPLGVKCMKCSDKSLYILNITISRNMNPIGSHLYPNMVCAPGFYMMHNWSLLCPF